MTESSNLEKKKDSVPPPPAIYKLIEQKAASADIVSQLSADFYDPGRNPEKVFLAIDELQRRGAEGAAILREIGTGTDELGILIREIEEDRITGDDLEERLGIDRFSNITDADTISVELFFKVAYEHAKERGYTKKSYSQCLHEYLETKRSPINTHLSEIVENEVVSQSTTFGQDEVEYLELLGPREILRLRSMSKPSFLLLGSYGVYSAREFRNYVNKINPAGQPFVIDMGDASIERLARDPGNTGNIVQADARSLPFEKETFDHIYTNKLLRFLGENEGSSTRVNVSDLLYESFRALKPGGSLVMSEYPISVSFYASEPLEANSIETFRSCTQDFIKLAEEAGFRVEELNSDCLSFAVRKEAGSSTIDENGFPQYGEALISERAYFSPFGVRLVKP